MKLKSSDDYDGRYQFFDFNRSLITKHVRQMRDKIAFYGQQFNLIVIVTDLFTGTRIEYIAEGQHRYTAMKDLGIPFYYLERDDFTSKREIAKYIASLNATAMPWRLDDYLHAWSTIGIDSYRIMASKKETSGIITNNLISFYSLQQSSGTLSRVFKNGEMEINNLELSTRLINTYQVCKPYMIFENWTDKSKFADWIIGNHPNQEKLLNIVKNNKIPGDSLTETLDKLYNQ